MSLLAGVHLTYAIESAENIGNDTLRAFGQVKLMLHGKLQMASGVISK